VAHFPVENGGNLRLVIEQEITRSVITMNNGDFDTFLKTLTEKR